VSILGTRQLNHGLRYVNKISPFPQRSIAYMRQSPEQNRWLDTAKLLASRFKEVVNLSVVTRK
jgi:hypothetical protein